MGSLRGDLGIRQQARVIDRQDGRVRVNRVVGLPSPLQASNFGERVGG
jgi:hypothetical protein